MIRVKEQCGDVARLLTFLLYRIGNIFARPNIVIADELLNLAEVTYPMLLVRVHTFVSAPCTRFVLSLLQQIPIGHSVVNVAVPFHLASLAFSIAGPFERIFLLTPCVLHCNLYCSGCSVWITRILPMAKVRDGRSRDV